MVVPVVAGREGWGLVSDRNQDRVGRWERQFRFELGGTAAVWARIRGKVEVVVAGWKDGWAGGGRAEARFQPQTKLRGGEEHLRLRWKGGQQSG